MEYKDAKTPGAAIAMTASLVGEARARARKRKQWAIVRQDTLEEWLTTHTELLGEKLEVKVRRFYEIDNDDVPVRLKWGIASRKEIDTIKLPFLKGLIGGLDAKARRYFNITDDTTPVRRLGDNFAVWLSKVPASWDPELKYMPNSADPFTQNMYAVWTGVDMPEDEDEPELG